MRKVFSTGSVKGVIDPQEAWPDVTSKDILISCGLLPMWFDSFATRHTSKPAPIPVKDWMAESYGFGQLYEMTQNTKEVRSGSTITDKGTHRFPGDPDLPPMVTMEADNGAQLIQWHHGIVAFRDKPEDPWFLTRMD